MQEGMLARFAMALQRGQIEAIGGQGFGGQGGTIVVDDNCEVRWSRTGLDCLALTDHFVRLCDTPYIVAPSRRVT